MTSPVLFVHHKITFLGPRSFFESIDVTKDDRFKLSSNNFQEI